MRLSLLRSLSEVTVNVSRADKPTSLPERDFSTDTNVAYTALHKLKFRDKNVDIFLVSYLEFLTQELHQHQLINRIVCFS